ncbi:MAG: hypothetical protein JJ902_11125 [Roseibium sp.]|nr:hypothetical protein [Roseibium sp.]
MTQPEARALEARTAEQRAQSVVHRVMQQAEPIPAHLGGGHKLDVQTLYEEVLGALRETIDDLAFCTPGRS